MSWPGRRRGEHRTARPEGLSASAASRPVSARAPRLVLLSFALLALILESALVLYWNTLLEPRLRSEAQAQAQLLAQAQVHGIVQALALPQPQERAARLADAIDGLLLLRDAGRDETYFSRIRLRLDYEQVAAPPGSLDRDEGSIKGSVFEVQVPLYHPVDGTLIGAADIAVGSGFYQAFSADVRRQLVGQGLFIAVLLGVLGGALHRVLRKLEQQALARRSAEQALAANERQLQQLIDNLDHYFVYGRDAQGGIVRVSESVHRVLGIPADEFLRKARELPAPDPAGMALPQPAGGPRSGGSRQFEFELRDHAGALHRVECTEVVVRDGSGRITGTDGIARDVSAQRQLESELRAARDQAEAANRAKSQFLANMSHEIRTPMNAVIGMATLLGKSPLASRQRSQLAQLQTSARMLLSIIDDILDLSRIEAGKLSILSRDFSLDELLSDLTALVGQRARDKRLDVLIDCDPEIPAQLRGDAMRLQQVLVNLVVNAIKFTEQGEVVIGIGCLARDADGITLQFSVRDTGIGIPAEALPRLFEQFTQMDESSTRRHGGAGLGLAISKRLVELMGGRLEAESAVGEGSTFRFSVRFGLGEAPAGMASPLRAGLRALVVDDSAVARDVFGSMLEAMRFEVRLAGSAGQAVAMAQEAVPPFDLLLIDYRLPDLDGLQAVRELRRRRRLPASVMVTAYGDENLAAEAERCGVDVFLQKPISPSALHDAAARALHLRSDAHPAPAFAKEEPRFAAGQHVLVVEDNEVNREVAGELLGGLGLAVTMAETGAAALRCVEQQHFDLVLMDVQMPEVDGIEATRRLRQDARWSGLPVVALTAHAMASDRERFLAAGMDDYLAKPIEERDLLRVLARWLRTDGAVSPQPPAAPASAAEPCPPLPGIDVDGALARINGKWPLLLRLLDSFRQQHRADADEIGRLLDAGRADAVAAQVHALKGAAQTLGITGLAQAAQALEQALLQERDATPALEDLRAALAALQALALPHPTVPPPAGATALPALLGGLQAALQARRFEALALARELLAALPGPARDSDAGVALARAVEHLDLAQAETALRRLQPQLTT